jgi:hypothetical protein
MCSIGKVITFYLFCFLCDGLSSFSSEKNNTPSYLISNCFYTFESNLYILPFLLKSLQWSPLMLIWVSVTYLGKTSMISLDVVIFSF